MRELKDLVRANIWNLKPYSCARDEFKGREANVFLDANENPYNGPYNRYPDPLQTEVKARLASLKGVKSECIFLGNGSDEAIDLVYRIFCQPGRDNVVAMAPTYGMYQVSADINQVEYRKVPLGSNYELCAEDLLAAVDGHTKAIFLCSPNNPTGSLIDQKELFKILYGFDGIVVLDEAYSDFSPARPMRLDLDHFPRLIVLNTFSKAWASAGIRLGMAFASEEIIQLFNKVKYPYNINQLTQQKALEILGRWKDVEGWVKIITDERPRMMMAVAELPVCLKVWPSWANFFLAKMTDAQKIYHYLIDCGIVVRSRHNVELCENCLRITIGSPSENTALLSALRRYNP